MSMCEVKRLAIRVSLNLGSSGGAMQVSVGCVRRVCSSHAAFADGTQVRRYLQFGSRIRSCASSGISYDGWWGRVVVRSAFGFQILEGKG